MQIVSFACNVKAYFSDKNKKKIFQYVVCWNFLSIILSVKGDFKILNIVFKVHLLYYIKV